MKKIAATVVTYNRKKLLLDNIKELLSQTAYDQMDIIIVDNASTDGTREALEEYIQAGQIIYQNTGANTGASGGFCYSAKYAAEMGYEYVWMMDDDCMPTPTALEKLLEAAAEIGEDYGFVSSKVLWTDGTPCLMNIQGETMYRPVRDFTSKQVVVATATFVSLFIPIKVIKDIGVPIKEFFIWSDDWEFTRRMSLKYKCYLINDSVVIHKMTSNIGSNIAKDTIERLNRYSFMYRNEFYVWRREGIKGLCRYSIRVIAHIVRVLLYAKDYKWQRIKCILKSVYKGLSFNPPIEYVNTVKANKLLQ